MLETLVANAPLVLLAAGLVLMAVEAMSPGAYFIVIGVALAGAGLIGLLFPGGLDVFVLAGLTLGIGFAATWVYREFDFYGGKGKAQTSDSSSLAGSIGYATKPITSRSGEVKIDGGGFAPYYSARTNGDVIEEGSEVIVIDPGGGNVLTVQDMNALESDEIDRELARGRLESSADATETGREEADGALSSDDASSSVERVDDGGVETEMERETDAESES